MTFLLHIVILFSFSCKAEINQTTSTGIQNKTILTDSNRTSNIWAMNWSDNTNITSFTTASQSVNQGLYTSKTRKSTTVTLKIAPESTRTTGRRKITPEPTKMTTKMAPYITTKKPFLFTSPYVRNYTTNIPASAPCACKDNRYKTGIMICAIIIAVLVLICAVLVICSVALANKVSSLKTKLTQSKRQARSNGDFLNASSILWSSGMETWQKKPQTANQTMDEISLGETITDEKHKLMTVPQIEMLKDPTENKKTTSANDETLTIVSTVEV